LSGCTQVPIADLKITHSGVFIKDAYKPISEIDQNSTSGRLTTSDPEIVCQTDKIPMKLGVTFGIHYKIVGLDKTLIDIPVTVETHHPTISGYDGKSTEIDVWQSKTSHFENGGHIGGAMFFFEAEYELVEGDWKIVVQMKKLSM